MIAREGRLRGGFVASPTLMQAARGWGDIAWNSFLASSGTTLRMSLISGLSKFSVFAASKSENETRYLEQHHHPGGGFTWRPSRCVITGQSMNYMQFS